MPNNLFLERLEQQSEFNDPTDLQPGGPQPAQKPKPIIDDAAVNNIFLGKLQQSEQPSIPEPSPETAFEYDVAMKVAEVANIIGEEVVQGGRQAAQEVELLIRDIAQIAGIPTPDGKTPSERQREVEFQREQFRESEYQRDNPTLAKAVPFGVSVLGLGAGVLGLARKGLKNVIKGPVKRELASETVAGTGVGATELPDLSLADEDRLKARAQQGAIGGAAAAALTTGVLGAIKFGSKFTGEARRARELKKAIEDTGEVVTPTVGQVQGPGTIHTIETFLTKFPYIGLRAANLAKVKQLQNGIEDYVASLRPEGFVPSPETTLSDEIYISLKGKYEKVNRVESKLYQRVLNSKAADELHSVPDLQEYAVKSIEKLYGTKLKSTTRRASIRKLTQLLEDTFDQPQWSFNTLHDARQRIDDVLSMAKRSKSTGNTGNLEISILTGLRKLMEDNLGKIAESNGAGQAYKKAKQFYIDNKLPYDHRNILNALDPDAQAVDPILSALQSPSRPDEALKAAKILVKNLDKRGRQTLEYGLVKRAADKSIEKGVGLDPVKFGKELQKLGESADIVFSPQTKAAIDGYTKIANVMKNEIQLVMQEASRAQSTDLVLAGAAVAGLATEPGATLLTYGLLRASATLLASKTGVKLLTKLGKGDEGNKIAQKIAKELVRGMIARGIKLPGQPKEEEEQQ